jgi:hypothetical protein
VWAVQLEWCQSTESLGWRLPCLARGCKSAAEEMSDEDEGEVEWYIELAESIPIPVYILLVRRSPSHICSVAAVSQPPSPAQPAGAGVCAILQPGTCARWLRGRRPQFLLPIIASFIQIAREEQERKARKRR